MPAARLPSAIVATLLLVCSPRTLAAQTAAPTSGIGWIGLYTSDLIEWLENGNRLPQLCPPTAAEDVHARCVDQKLAPKVLRLRLYREPSKSARSAGDVVVIGSPKAGLHAEYLAPGRLTSRALPPDLHDGDWGYGPYFHLTVVEQRGTWVRLPSDPLPPGTWLDTADFGPTPPLRWLDAGEIVTSHLGDLYILGIENGVVRARAEQERDMPCDADVVPPVAPFKELRLDRTSLFTPTGHLRLRIKYTRGC